MPSVETRWKAVALKVVNAPETNRCRHGARDPATRTVWDPTSRPSLGKQGKPLMKGLFDIPSSQSMSDE